MRCLLSNGTETELLDFVVESDDVAVNDGVSSVGVSTGLRLGGDAI